MKRTVIIGTALSFLFILCGCHSIKQNSTDVSSGEYWKAQALHGIIPYWTQYASDTVYGAFYTNIDGNWKSGTDTRKYPSMISRHIFGYAVAYLLSGNEHYLDIASKAKDFLIEHAWDKQYGGWYDVLDQQGNPVERTKNMFIQVYAVTGLTMYYFVTHDKTVLSYIEQSDSLLAAKAWDTVNGGYYNVMTQGWKVLDSRKTFAAQVAPVSGYLLYLYQATMDHKYLDRAEQIMNAVCAHMIDRENGWVLESCDATWQYIPGNPDETNIGHNLEVAWMLMRLSLLENNPSYIHDAATIRESLLKWGFGHEKGIWYNTVERTNPEQHSNFTYWWIQAYGNMFDLCSFRTFGKPEYLNDFVKGARLWDSCFIDRKHGDTYFSIYSAGGVKDSIKANPYKASYHTMEHCLLNYAYLNFWVSHRPVKLHFLINADAKGDTLYPSPVEGRQITITKATCMKNGQEEVLKTNGQAVILPQAGKLAITTFLECNRADNNGK